MRNYFILVFFFLRLWVWGDIKRILNFICNRWKEDIGSNLKRWNIYIGCYEFLIFNDIFSEIE